MYVIINIVNTFVFAILSSSVTDNYISGIHEKHDIREVNLIKIDEQA